MTAHNSRLQNHALTEKIEHRTSGRPFSIHHTDVSANSSSALYIHCHSELEFFYLSDGELYFYIEDNVYHMHAGDAILIPSGLIHYATRVNNDGKKCSYEAVVFSPKMLIDTLPSYCENYLDSAICNSIAGVYHLTPDTEWKKTAIDYVTGIFDYISVAAKNCELIIRGRLLIAWQLLYNNVYSDLISGNNYRPIYPLLNRCIEIINSDYMYDFSLAELASSAGLSEGHFCRVFKDITGFTPFNYINRVRITKACAMLTCTDKKIADISAGCGFNNISYFNRTFKQIMKESPSVYRKNFHNIT